MQRFFNSTDNEMSPLSKEDEHHLLSVMRAQKGEQIEIVINGECFLFQIESLKPFKLKTIKKIDVARELENDLTLYYCLVKKDKADLVIQKAVELGVKEIVLVQSERSIVRLKREDFSKKLERYQSIARAAAMQSKRLIIPEVKKIMYLKDFSKSDCKTHNFIANENVSGSTKNFKSLLEKIKPGESISLLIGPEGGFTQGEIDKMNKLGFINISLGKRILRSETAAISALSIAAFILEV